jgi:DNA-binding MarR family transcriptional regulator
VKAAPRPNEAAEPPLPLGPTLGFLRLLWSLDHELDVLSKSMATRLGVTGPQRLALRIVGRFPGITAGRLADILQLHPSTLTGVLSRLEGRGLVRRRPDPGDKRRALLGLTAAGSALAASTEGTIEGCVERLLAVTPAGRLAEAERVLAALVSVLRQASAPPASRSGGAPGNAPGRKHALGQGGRGDHAERTHREGLGSGDRRRGVRGRAG